MARRLVGRGKHVLAVINLDTGRPDSDLEEQKPASIVDLPRRFLEVFGAGGPVAVTRRATRWLVRRYRNRPTPRRVVAADPINSHVVAATRRAWHAFEIPICPGTMVLIRSSEMQGLTKKNWHINYWSERSEALVTHVVQSDHDDMLLEPNVAGLATVIKDCVRDALRETAQPGLS